MSATKIAISMDETLLQRLDRLVKTRSFRSRSQLVQEAVAEKISRMDKTARARVRQARPQIRAGFGRRRTRHGNFRMAQILRGDIYWAELDPTKGHEQAGQRPVLILSNEVFNQRSGTPVKNL